MSKIFYEEPTQVVFWDETLEEWVGGIVYQDFIICGCCGGVKKIDGLEIHEYDTWNDISGEIIGGELPHDIEFIKNDEEVV